MIERVWKEPKSSFLSVDKDLQLIINRIIANKRLQRLLYYTTPDALDRPNLTQEQMVELFGKNIKLVPKLYVDGSVLAYIIISCDNFIPNDNNPQFRDKFITFDIICHFNQWQMNDMALRPYKIAGELDSMLDNEKLTGIGELHFMGANQIVINDEFAGLSMVYVAINGGEDKKFMPNPEDEPQFLGDFHDMVEELKSQNG